MFLCLFYKVKIRRVYLPDLRPNVHGAALYMAAVDSLKHNKELRTLYHPKLSQGKTEKQATICVAKKLL